MKLADIKPNPDNPRSIKKEKLDKLAQSIKDFPKMMIKRPIVYDENKVIIGGNMRYRAIQSLGMKEIPDEWVSDASDFTPDERDRFIMQDNAEMGEHDWDMVANQYELEDLEAWGIDVPYADTNDEVEEDEAPEVSSEPPVSQLGEVYQLGRHRVMCGDSLKDIDTLMGETIADMIFTDPPYNVDYGSSKNPRHKIRSIENDSMNDSDWAEFNSHLAQTMSARCSGDVYVFGAPSPDGMRARLAYVDAGFHWSATIIWKKQQLVLSPAKYQRIYEPCFYGWHEKGKSSFVGDRKQVELWEIDRPLNSKEHPTMKPIELCAKGILNSSKKNDIVLDLFLGSGSTLIACEQTDRTCYGMELDPKYVDVIRKRYAKFIGEEDWEAVTPAIQGNNKE